MTEGKQKLVNFLSEEIQYYFEFEKDFAKRSGVAPNRLSEFLCMRRDIRLDTFLNYLQALDITIVLDGKRRSRKVEVTPDELRQIEIKFE